MAEAAKKKIELSDEGSTAETEDEIENHDTTVELQFTAQQMLSSGDLTLTDTVIEHSLSDVSATHTSLPNLNLITNEITEAITDAKIKVDKLEAQVKLIALFSGEAKMLESEINKIVKVIYAKHPEMKPYLLKIKKLLKDHADIEKNLEKAKDVK